MTLEQIKNRQERINEQLYTLLSNTEGVMNRIIGHTLPDEKGLGVAEPIGLIQEINRQQELSEMCIERLSNYNKELVNSTYAPEEVLCQVKSAY
ncbi:MAG TPA: hypothetical protein VLA48_02945 [Nitrososphaeraceae archaeon]|nr:hypothetical protein [Nitrososphaeraceae archaeon]